MGLSERAKVEKKKAKYKNRQKFTKYKVYIYTSMYRSHMVYHKFTGMESSCVVATSCIENCTSKVCSKSLLFTQVIKTLHNNQFVV